MINIIIMGEEKPNTACFCSWKKIKQPFP